MKKAFAVVLMIMVFAAGCAYNYAGMGDELEAGLGKMTYSQAKEKWGEPTEVEQAAESFTAHWYTEQHEGRSLMTCT